MRAFIWSRTTLLWKTATPLKCAGWWSGLTNCSALQQPLTLKFTTRDLEAKAHGWVKTLVLFLKQYHTHYYHFYEKGTTRAMVGLLGLHFSDIFRCTNVSSSVGFKSFCPWCFKFGDNTELISTHLREVHYQLAIACDLCKLFASMSAQSVLEQCSGCKAKHINECTEQEGSEAKKLRKKSKVQEQEKAP